jgi:hypothetical protein
MFHLYHAELYYIESNRNKIQNIFLEKKIYFTCNEL